MSRWTADHIPDLTGRVAIVTGANTGLGLETTRQLAAHGARVVLACRSVSKGQAAIDVLEQENLGENLELRLLDLADLESVETFAAWAAEALDRLDILVNNAGVMMCPESRTSQGFEMQFGVNHLGHFVLTAKLWPLLAKTEGARIVNVSSGAHRAGRMDFDDLNWNTRSYDRMAAYGQSKLANLLFTLELQKRLEQAGAPVKVTAAHPGWTGTDLQRHFGIARLLNPLLAMSVDKGALAQLRAATDPEAPSGTYYGPSGPMEVWGYPAPVGRTAAAKDGEAARKLWERSEELTGVTFEVGSPAAAMA